MADRRPITKARAKRIEIEYFKRPHPLRKTKFVLSIAAPALAALWLLAGAVQGDQRLYTSGSVSSAHFMFDSACSECHQPTTMMGATKQGGSYFLKATNVACERCHAGPVHHDTQVVPASLRETGTEVPRCATCHVEHEGHVVLADLDGRHCTSCHDRLDVKGGTAKFETRVTDFSTDHPQFAVEVAGRGRVRLDDKTPPRDGTQVLLNHKKHLKVGLRDADKLKGKPGVLERDGQAQLGCAFCHRTDARGVAIQPVNYHEHCATCHALEVDGKVPGAVAPHEEPAIVHAYLRTLYVEAHEQCRAGAPDSNAVAKGWCEKLQLASAAPAAGAPADAARPAEGGESRGRLLRRPEGGAEPEKQDKPEEGESAPRRLRRGSSLEHPRVHLASAATSAAPGEFSLLGLLRRASAFEPGHPVIRRTSRMLAQAESPRRLLRGGPAEEPAQEAPAESPRRLRRGGDEPKEDAAPAEGGRRLLRGGGDAPAAEAPKPAPRAVAGGPGALQWADEQLQRIEKRIFGQCAECHVKDDAAPRQPAFKKTAMPGPRRMSGPEDPADPRWLRHSVFDHGVHRPTACTECHDKARTSEDTGDVLLPQIKVCRECHTPGGGARTTCVECHLYHDKAKERDMSGPFEIRQLTRRAPAAPAAAPGAAPGPSK